MPESARPRRPAVTVHGAAQAGAALARAGPDGVLLLSPPAAATWAGAGWFLALVDQARTAQPGVPCDAALDCGDQAGAALAAIRAGAAAVILDGACPGFPAVAAAAAEAGAALWPVRPESLDLGALDLGRRDTHKKIADWLSCHRIATGSGQAPLPVTGAPIVR